VSLPSSYRSRRGHIHLLRVLPLVGCQSKTPTKTKAKERREVGEGDDTVVVEDTSDEDDDEETLQDRFQLRSRFSRPGLPHVPLVQDPPASLEPSLAAPPRKPRNASRKRVSKKLKVTEAMSPEVSRLE
jgi:hypothetical protein